MKSSTPLPRTASRDLALALTAFALASTIVLVAAWSVRSEAREQKSSHTSTTHTSYGYTTDSKDGGFSYALFQPGSNTTISVGDEEDRKKFTRLMKTIDEETLWFSIGGKDYVVTDASIVSEADDILAPMRELGERQGRLGGIQGELGAQQGQLGARQGALGARQGELGARLAAVVLDRDADEERAEIEREMRVLERKQEALSREQEPLGRKQAELGRKQAELGKQQERISARAGAAIRELADECIANGKAKRM